MIRAHVFAWGAGNVGRHLLRLVRDRRAEIASREGVDIQLVAASNRRTTLIDAAGLDIDAALDSLDRGGPRALDPSTVVSLLARLSNPVLVDATASHDAASLYAHALSRGVAVVTANKIPLSGDGASYTALLAAAAAAPRSLHYETTVGADLPVLTPIADRIRSGDRVTKIVGSLSGTLGFLSDAVSRGTSVVAALEEARARGYTEPDPREDLSGKDVARKAIILARAIGLEVEPEEVDLTPFPSSDADARILGAGSERVLRYLAVIDPHAVPSRRVRVAPEAVERDHPAAGLRGPEALVSLTTERCGDCPITIRGPGAGGLVTASGLLADIVRSARPAAHGPTQLGPMAARPSRLASISLP